MSRVVTRGRPWPLGVTVAGDGVDVAVHSADAEQLWFCLYEADAEAERIALPFRTGDVWHAHIGGVRPGARYGLRASGPLEPDRGLYFDVQKLLIDPYAKLLDGPLHWDARMSRAGETVFGFRASGRRDSAAVVPKGVVVDDAAFDWGGDAPVRVDDTRRVIYEAHVKGLTALHPDVPEALRGTYAGFATEPVLDHLRSLGVTTIELLPIFAFLDDEFLVRRGLRNYWGYQPICFQAPEPRYAAGGPQAAVAECKAMVRALHRAGFEVILDVVFNHTGEGGADGPWLSLRGLGNPTYYRMLDGGGRFADDTGTGNTLNTAHPAVTRLVLDSMRYWREQMHVDGFRLDLAAALGRTEHGFDAGGALLQGMAQDPVIGRSVLVAEPWDVGPGGYQLGAFPQPFHEWNDRFRDAMRLAWRDDDLACVHIASRVLGTADRFDRHHRSPLDSINFVTAHDGFTLRDLVSYSRKHNEANRERNLDGLDDNVSDNLGVEGATDDPAILEARGRRMRALLATLFVAQGTPMLLGGDELGNTQDGNNNAYAQDNEIGWVRWDAQDPELTDVVRRLIAVRHREPILRQPVFLHGTKRPRDGQRDVVWRRGDGQEPTDHDWHDRTWRTLVMEVRGSAHDPETAAEPGAVLVIFAIGSDAEAVRLPDPGGGREWSLEIDTSRPRRDSGRFADTYDVEGQAVVVLTAADPVSR